MDLKISKKGRVIIPVRVKCWGLIVNNYPAILIPDPQYRIEMDIFIANVTPVWISKNKEIGYERISLKNWVTSIDVRAKGAKHIFGSMGEFTECVSELLRYLEIRTKTSLSKANLIFDRKCIKINEIDFKKLIVNRNG